MSMSGSMSPGPTPGSSTRARLARAAASMSACMDFPSTIMDLGPESIEDLLAGRLELRGEQAVGDAKPVPRHHHGTDLLIAPELRVGQPHLLGDRRLVGWLPRGRDHSHEV